MMLVPKHPAPGLNPGHATLCQFLPCSLLQAHIQLGKQRLRVDNTPAATELGAAGTGLDPVLHCCIPAVGVGASE